MQRALASLFLRATGWQPEGARPAARRCVLIAAPHTSNWDLAYLLALTAVFDLRVSWMGKDTLFSGPFGRILRRLGGIPVDRTHRGNLVRQMTELFENGPELVLTGEMSQDMDEIRNFYSDKVGKYPESFGPVRLKEEM